MDHPGMVESFRSLGEGRGRKGHDWRVVRQLCVGVREASLLLWAVGWALCSGVGGQSYPDFPFWALGWFCAS